MLITIAHQGHVTLLFIIISIGEAERVSCFHVPVYKNTKSGVLVGIPYPTQSSLEIAKAISLSDISDTFSTAFGEFDKAPRENTIESLKTLKALRIIFKTDITPVHFDRSSAWN